MMRRLEKPLGNLLLRLSGGLQRSSAGTWSDWLLALPLRLAECASLRLGSQETAWGNARHWLFSLYLLVRLATFRTSLWLETAIGRGVDWFAYVFVFAGSGVI